MTDRVIAVLATLLLAMPAWPGVRETSLPELIDLLRAEGLNIVYSSALVNSQQRVTVEAVDLDSLRAGLQQYDLALVQSDGIWVVKRRTAAPTDPVPQIDVEVRPLETVIVTGSRHELPYAGPSSPAYSFTPEDLTLVPTLGSDAMRATLRLPGVSSLGVSAKPRIRGGLQDELLVMQDGLELMEPFHLADYHSPYSSIDYHTIESIDVYTGGFPSRYGYRMSGVMDIRNQWQEDEYDTDIGVSSFSNFIHTRGSIGGEGRGAWLLSLRHGDLTDLTDYIETRSGDPIYSDISARLNFEVNDGLQLNAGLVWAEDDIRFGDEEEEATSQIDSWYAWTGGTWLPNEKTAARFTLSLLDFARDKNQASFEEDEEDPGKGGFLQHRQDVERIALRNDWSVVGDRKLWEFGWQLEYNRGAYRHSARIDRGDLAAILGTEEEVDRDIAVRTSGWSGGGYAQLDWDLTPRLSVQPSLRWDAQNYYIDRGSEFQWSPRLGASYEWSQSTQLRLSLGRFHQQEGIQELQVIDGVTHFFKPQYADQVVAGLRWQRGAIEATGEIYYKRYSGLKGRFENIFNPFVLLPEMEPDRVGLRPDKARATGLDLDVGFILAEPASAYFRYSYMDAEDRIDSKWVDRRWSQQHTISTGAVWQGDSFSVSVGLTWHSGWRTTRLPGFVPEDTIIPLNTVLNNTQLDDYVSLDINARKHWVFPRCRVEIYADIVNVTDRRNEAGIDFDIEEVDDGYELTPDRETLLGRVPSVGITLSF